MRAKAAPTARRRRLGSELRRMRAAAGLSVSKASQRLGIERTTISNLEAGRLGVSEERVRSLAGAYGVADRSYIDALAAMAEERGRGWWEEYRGKLSSAALDLAELEDHAVHMRSVQIMHLPGLLQTEEYAKAVFSAAVPEPTPAELRRYLSFRMRRRDVLDGDEAPHGTFLVHEAAFLLAFGGAWVTRRQARYMLEASERENITLRIIPFSAGGFPNAGSSITYVSGPVRQLDTVHFDTPNDVCLVDDPAVLERYRTILDKIQDAALTTAKTQDFLLEITKLS